jgi:hypothetical protein
MDEYEEIKWLRTFKPEDRLHYTEVVEYGLPSDYFNEWMGFNSLPLASLNVLQVIPTFEEYVNNSYSDAIMRDFILRRSNPQKVKQMDALAAEFNTALNKIKSEKDVEALRDFYRRAMSIKNA